MSLACPTCGAAVPLPDASLPAAFPFCSPRCRVRDLGAWADGRHVIPGGPIDPELDHLPDLDRP
jgi:endogenous inhibitor of DNA gyrase (YacG/DUF329 family)